MHVGGISCDLAKAFDGVSHELLLPKVHFYGILDVADQWFKSYLYDRRQQVEIKSPGLNNSTYSELGHYETWSYSRFNTWSSAFYTHTHTRARALADAHR
jgi:hypothetical protein